MDEKTCKAIKGDWQPKRGGCFVKARDFDPDSMEGYFVNRSNQHIHSPSLFDGGKDQPVRNLSPDEKVNRYRSERWGNGVNLSTSDIVHIAKKHPKVKIHFLIGNRGSRWYTAGNLRILLA